MKIKFLKVYNRSFVFLCVCYVKCQAFLFFEIYDIAILLLWYKFGILTFCYAWHPQGSHSVVFRIILLSLLLCSNLNSDADRGVSKENVPDFKVIHS